MVFAYLKQTSQHIIFQEHNREPTEHKAPPTAPGGPGKGRGRRVQSPPLKHKNCVVNNYMYQGTVVYLITHCILILISANVNYL